MIKVNNINGIPESTPGNYVASHSDGAFFYFFETKEEWEEFFSSLPKVWSKEAYSNEITSAVDAMVSVKLLELNYTNFNGEPSVGDVAAGVANNEAEWHLEAIEVNKWYASVYSAMYSHLSEVTEQTAQPIETFINSLPKFDN